MRLYTSFWNNAKTFKLMPIDKDCPYLEVIYDPTTTLLVVLTKVSKKQFQMLPKLDEDGNPQMAKKPKQNGSPYREQRQLVETYHEYYIEEKSEQEELIEFLASNSDFDYKRFLRDLESEKKLVPQEAKPLLDDKGHAVKGK